MTASQLCLSEVLGRGGSWRPRRHVRGYCGHSLGGRREDRIGSWVAGVELKPGSIGFWSCDFYSEVLLHALGAENSQEHRGTCSPPSSSAPSRPGGVLQHEPVGV